ncbi:hypothetical protein AAMO2058_001656900 [Amorphochlora amoebiformis]
MAAKLLWAPVVLDAEKAGKDGKPTGKKEKGVGVTKWKEREAKLQDFLKKLPDKYDYRVSFEDGKFAFVDQKNVIWAQAGVRLLLSYNVKTKSVVGGWANPSVLKKYAAPEVKSIPRKDVGPKDVKEISYKIADAAKCDYIYKAVNKNNWVFLGLIGLNFLEPKKRKLYNSSTGWLELLVMILGRLRTVIRFKAAPIAIAKAFNDAGILLLQQAKTAYSSNKTAVAMLNMGGTIARTIANELKTWVTDKSKAYDQNHIKTILQRLLEFEQKAIMSGRENT